MMIEGSGSIPVPPDPDQGGPKTYGSDGPGVESGSATLVNTEILDL